MKCREEVTMSLLVEYVSGAFPKPRGASLDLGSMFQEVMARGMK
jgi:hypothetical protein